MSDFKVGDPVVMVNSSICTTIVGLRPDIGGWFYNPFVSLSHNIDIVYSFDDIRHPTPEELEKYFRK